MTATEQAHILEQIDALSRQVRAMALDAPTAELRADEVIDAVCAAFEVERSNLLSNRKFVRLVNARWAACLMLQDLGITYSSIGRILKRDHAAILHGIRRIKDLLDVDPDYRQKLERARTLLKGETK